LLAVRPFLMTNGDSLAADHSAGQAFNARDEFIDPIEADAGGRF